MSTHEILEREKMYKQREYHFFFNIGLKLDDIIHQCGLDKVVRAYPNDITIDNRIEGCYWSFNVILITDHRSDILMEKISKSINVYMIESVYLEVFNVNPSGMLVMLISDYKRNNIYIWKRLTMMNHSV